jgi:hypothetical protein
VPTTLNGYFFLNVQSSMDFLGCGNHLWIVAGGGGGDAAEDVVGWVVWGGDGAAWG